jgi:hypothetical protein
MGNYEGILANTLDLVLANMKRTDILATCRRFDEPSRAFRTLEQRRRGTVRMRLVGKAGAAFDVSLRGFGSH